MNLITWIKFKLISKTEAWFIIFRVGCAMLSKLIFSYFHNPLYLIVENVLFTWNMFCVLVSVQCTAILQQQVWRVTVVNNVNVFVSTQISRWEQICLLNNLSWYYSISLPPSPFPSPNPSPFPSVLSLETRRWENIFPYQPKAYYIIWEPADVPLSMFH